MVWRKEESVRLELVTLPHRPNTLAVYEDDSRDFFQFDALELTEEGQVPDLFDVAIAIRPEKPSGLTPRHETEIRVGVVGPDDFKKAIGNLIEGHPRALMCGNFLRFFRLAFIFAEPELSRILRRRADRPNAEAIHGLIMRAGFT